jgi:predicted outer membrane repeat protein
MMGELYTIISDCTFTNNSASFSGGAISGENIININDSTFEGNHAHQSGGAVCSDNGRLTITNCDFINNSAYCGGAIGCNEISDPYNLTIINSYFTNNTASGDGGAIFTHNMVINNSVFTNNTSKPYGSGSRFAGAVFCQENGIITGSLFKGNSAGMGGAVVYGNGSLNISNSDFINNTAYSGGAITCSYMDTTHYLTVKDCSFTNNSAEKYGGAILTDYLNVSNSYFVNNSAMYDGGCIIATNSTSVTNCSFINNSAGNYGGAICSRNDLNIQNSFLILNSTFISNNANYGGAIYSSNAEIHFNRFTDNSAMYGNDMYTTSSSMNANYNWWGSNAGPNGRVYGLTINKWLVLNINADPSIIRSSQTSNISVDLLHDNGILSDPAHPELYYHDPANGHVPNGVLVYFITSLGTLESPLMMNNGIVLSTLNIGSLVNGIITVSAIVDDQTVQTPVNIDKIIPTIISVDPLNNGSTNDTSKIIKVTFSEAIKNGTGWIEFKKSTGTAMNFTMEINGKVLSIKPSLSLMDGKYILILHTGSLTDLFGNSIQLFSSIFTMDKNPPIVSSTDPAKNAQNILTNKIMRINFNEPIKAGTGYIELKTSSGKLIPIIISIIGNVLTINHPILTKGTKNTLILHTGSINDLAGNKMAPYSTYFTTRA